MIMEIYASASLSYICIVELAEMMMMMKKKKKKN